MTQLSTQKYYLKNLDCAACAGKIEAGLKKLPGIDEAVVDFANLTLHVKTNTSLILAEEMRGIDPEIEVVPSAEKQAAFKPDEGIGGAWLKREFIALAAATALFVVVLILENWFQSKSLILLKMSIVLTAYLLVGWNVLRSAVKTILGGTLFDENVLMLIATCGAMAIQAYPEAIGVMLFFKIGELLQNLAVSRSRGSIHALLASTPDKALIKTLDGYKEADPESVQVGDVILIKPGEKVPLDGEILTGSSLLDTSALTGEPVPVGAKPGDTVFAGQINQNGALTVRVTRPFSDSSIAKVMDLVENATAQKAQTEKFITTFARYYTPAVVLAAACIAIIPPLTTGASFQTWIYRALVLLVISCPCALVVSIPLGYFGGIGKASRKGILVKGSNFIDALAAVKTVVFDKTGTLTKGAFTVKDVVNLNGFSKEQLLEFAAAAELHSNHPIATALVAAYRKNGGQLDPDMVQDHLEISGKGVKARYKNHSIMVGSNNFLDAESIPRSTKALDGTTIHTVVDGNYAGHITIGDEIKPDAGKALAALKKLGVKHIAMLTGDNAFAAKSVAHKLGINQFVANLLPEDKVYRFEDLIEQQKTGGKIAFVGDGINDAPVLARADVGIAMGALGSDAAIESADVVIMNDSPMKMAEAVSIARQTRRIVWQNIILAFAIKGIFVLFGALGMATMWEAVFADVGTALIAVANSTRLIRSSLTEFN